MMRKTAERGATINKISSFLNAATTSFLDAALLRLALSTEATMNGGRTVVMDSPFPVLQKTACNRAAVLVCFVLLVLLQMYQSWKYLDMAWPVTNKDTRSHPMYDCDHDLRKAPAVASQCSLTNANDSKSASRMIILVHSGPALQEQRDLHRKVCFPLYNDIPRFFVTGLPSFDFRQVDLHDQGQLPTENETNVTLALLEEQRRYGDILVTPNRDYYRDKTEKLLGVLRYGVEFGARYILKSDDDYCINVSVAKHMLQRHERRHPGSELYGGSYYWNGTEYPQMRGPHNETAAFFSGHIIVMSRNLAKTIVGPDWMQNVLKAAYGTSSDDANLGKMVVRAKQNHNISVKVVANEKIKRCRLDRAKPLDATLRACHIETK